MIVRDKSSAFRLFFVIHGSVVPLILSKILFVTLLASAIAVTQHSSPGFIPDTTL